MRGLKKIIVVEDNLPLRQGLARIGTEWGAKVRVAGTAREGKALLAWRPDLVIVDVRLPDESALGLVEIASRLRPAPVIVAISGQASAGEAFRLAQHGVREFLAKPFSVSDLDEKVRKALNDPPDLEPFIVGSVGKLPMLDVLSDVRATMVEQAIALSRGSRSGAARLLKISRQAVQQTIKRLPNSRRRRRRRSAS